MRPTPEVPGRLRLHDLMQHYCVLKFNSPSFYALQQTVTQTAANTRRQKTRNCVFMSKPVSLRNRKVSNASNRLVKREAGEKPARTRHCKRTKAESTGRSQPLSNREGGFNHSRKPGDLPFLLQTGLTTSDWSWFCPLRSGSRGTLKGKPSLACRPKRAKRRKP